jgi:alpha-L-fucosidase 2
MLLQSQNGEINLLPALPSAWPDGEVKGLRASGGFEVDLRWQQGRLVQARVHSLAGQPATLRYGNVTRPLNLGQGEEITWDGRSL